MSIIIGNDKKTGSGTKDARRHSDKQKELIKENLPRVITDESIITGNKNKKIKIPIRSLEIPDFRPGVRHKGGRGDGGGEAGFGQGDGKKGDAVGKRPGKGQKPGSAGQEAGRDFIDAEFTVEELIEMMLEDLGLPNIKEKQEAKNILVKAGIKITGVENSGPWVLLNPSKTAKEGIKRFYSYLEIIKDETKKSELDCFAALKKCNGYLDEAMEAIAAPDFSHDEMEVVPFPILLDDDLRFHRLEDKNVSKSSAVVIGILDRSGSMDKEKKYLAKAMLFWQVNLLRKIYGSVEIRFIVHDEEACLTDEENFFKSESKGGTHCYTGLKLAGELIDSTYHTDQYNVYVMYFSDGDDFDSTRARTLEEVRSLVARGVSMIGYGNVLPDDGLYYESHNLFNVFASLLPVDHSYVSGIELLVGKKNFPFLGMKLRARRHIWPALQEFLKQSRSW
ncbi:MAG: DUF444 family protein [Candidatus Vogelbacteria bacterium]|nr:DUF444 family protein [Candidatus Vogelbacteria bacterium]